MVITYGYQKPLMQRIDIVEENRYNTYTIFERENLKVYYPFARQFIGNLLNQRTISRWETGGYIIESQTGSGKSTLILTTVVPVAKKQGKRVALIVPRTALSVQYKKDLAQEYQPSLLELLTDEGLNQHREFDNVDVYTMQELSNYGTRADFVKKHSTYEFVIFDEVHAFVGDAAFNPYTYDIFEFLVTYSQWAKRIYMTATLDIVIQEIVDMENNIPSGSYIDYLNRHIIINENVTLYRFKYDYSFLTVALFAEKNSGIEILENTPEGERVLAFVRSKASGLRLQSLLGKERAVFIDAESKMQSEADTFQQIISRGEFDKQFLIVTKFLDVGVNLLDETINRVVVFHQYKEDIVQMLGRKRIIKADNVTLYLYVPSQNCIQSQLNDLEIEYQSMSYNLRTYNVKRGVFNQLPKPLYAERKVNNWKIKSNGYAVRLNLYHQEQLNKLIDMQENWDYYEHYSKIIASWFPQCKELKWLDRTPKSEMTEKVSEILEPIIGQEFEKEKAVEIANNILRILNQPRRKEQENSMPTTVLKNLFKEHHIPYVFRNLSRGGKKGVYIVERGFKWQ